MKLVTLENDPDNSWSLNNILRQAGYHARGFSNVDEFLESPWSAESDLAIIESDGLDKGLIDFVAETLWPERPMLLIGSDEHALAALTRADDAYLLKPVSVRGLVASVKSVLSKAWDKYAHTGSMEFGAYRFDARERSVQVDGKRVALTHKEFQLALLLFRNLERPVSRVYIAEIVWRHDERINARTMTAHISAIRSKLQLGADSDYAITPIYNYGYRLDPVLRSRTAGARQTKPALPVAVPH
jgi:DNA-binding response OmpR family regulator